MALVWNERDEPEPLFAFREGLAVALPIAARVQSQLKGGMKTSSRSRSSESGRPGSRWAARGAEKLL